MFTLKRLGRKKEIVVDPFGRGRRVGGVVAVASKILVELVSAVAVYLVAQCSLQAEWSVLSPLVTCAWSQRDQQSRLDLDYWELKAVRWL